MNIKPTSMEVETIFDAACQHFADAARESELDVMRHDNFPNLAPAHTGMATTTREDLRRAAHGAMKRNIRLAEICRQMRERCHAKNLSDLFAALDGRLP